MYEMTFLYLTMGIMSSAVIIGVLMGFYIARKYKGKLKDDVD